MTDSISPSVNTEAVIRANTRPKVVPGLEPLQLWQADELTPLWEATEADLQARRMGPPFWAFPWAGGQAVCRYLLATPELVEGRSVLDLAAGSGMIAILAAKLGAARAAANDIDPYCEAAVALNANLNGVQVDWLAGDLLGRAPPAFDVIVAGDVFYEAEMAKRFLAFLQDAHAAGALVLVGDPGRTYFPRSAFTQVAEYEVATTREIESMTIKTARVWRL
jgi:predicted nicotinamide N-methyase